MNTARNILPAAGCWMILCACGMLCAAEKEKASLPEGITREQVDYLVESLGEAIADGDVKLLEMALHGLKSAGQSGPALQSHIEDGMYEAALRNYRARVRIDAWALTARAWAGDEDARARLREWAGADLSKPERRGADGADGAELNPRSERLLVRVRRKSEALLGLVFLKDESAEALTQKVLAEDLAAVTFKGAGDWQFNWSWNRWAQPQAEGAARALLRLKPEAGEKELIALIGNEQLKPVQRTFILGGLAKVYQEDEAEAKLKDLMPHYLNVFNAWFEDKDDERLLTERFAMLAPLEPLPRTKEGLEVMEKVRGALPRGIQRYMDGYIRGYRDRMKRSEKPTPPPKDTEPAAEF